MPIIEVNGRRVQFEDHLSREQIAKEIDGNPHLFDPTYEKPQTASRVDQVIEIGKSLASKLPGISRVKSIADQAEESSAIEQNTASPDIPGAPVRQSAYNRALLATPTALDNTGDGGVMARITDTASQDARGQEQQANITTAMAPRIPAVKPDVRVGDPDGGFLNAATSSLAGQTLKGLGRAAIDYTGADEENWMTLYGEELIKQNPTGVASLKDIKDKPFLAISEATGSMAGSMTGMAGVKLLGMGISSLAPLTGPLAPVVFATGKAVEWLGPAAIAALPSYGGIRDKQVLNDPSTENTAKDIAVATLGAATMGVIEVAFGPQQWALTMLTREGRAAMSRKFATTTVGQSAIKQALIATSKGSMKGAAIEGTEELVLNPIEQLASYEDPTTKANIDETLFGGAMGAIGGGVLGGGVGMASVTSERLKNQKGVATEAARNINSKESQDSINAIHSAESVDDAIQAANQSVSRKSVTPDDVLRMVDPTLGDIEKHTGIKPVDAIDQAIQEAAQITQQEQTRSISDGRQEETKAPAETVLLETDTEVKDPVGETAIAPEIVLPDGSSLPIAWEVVDADTVKATIKEGVNQPRDRTRASADIQVKSISKNPDYRRMSDSPVMDVGAPVLDADGNLVAGNGRFEGVSIAYDQGTHGSYLDSLKADLGTKGLDPSVIDGMQKPILVRRITQPFDTRALALASNSGGSLPYSALELAKIDAEKLKGISQISITDMGDISPTPANLEKIQQALQSYTGTEHASFQDATGKLSQEGVRRIKGAILYNAYGDSPTLSRLIESTDSDIRNITGVLMRVSGDVAKVRADIVAGGIPESLDITEDLLGAVEKFAQLKSQNQTVDQYLAQQQMFSDDISAESKDIMRVLSGNIRSQKKMSEFIRGAYDALANVGIVTGDVFGDTPLPTKSDVIRKAKQPTGQTQQGFLDEPTEPNVPDSQADGLANPGKPKGDIPSPLLSKAQTPSVLTRVDLQPLADKYNSRLTYGEVIVLEDVSALPVGVIDLSEGGNQVEGAFLGDGKAYVVANAFTSMERAQEVIEHELSHLAAEELLESKEYRAAIRSVQTLEKTKNKTIVELAKEVDKRQPGLDANTRAKEILALSVETGKYRDSNALKQIIADIIRAFKALLRKIGIASDTVEKMSEGEVFATMRRAMDMLYDGSERTKPVTRRTTLTSKALPIDEVNQPAKFNPNIDIPETRARATQRVVQDQFNRFTVIKEWLEKEKGIRVSEQADVFRAIERFHSKVANQLEDFRSDVRNPLIKKMAEAGYTKEQVDEYLLNQHAEEANIQNRKLTGADTMAFGISDEDADKYLANAPKELAAIANEIRAIADAALDLRLDSGLESEETYDAMKGAYKHYVPVKGDAESQEGRISKGVGAKGFDVKHKGKRRLGHSARNEDVIGNIFQDYERAVFQVEKNRVAKSLALMAAEIGMPELISISQPEKKRSIQNTKAYAVLVKGELQEVFQNREAANQNRQLVFARDKSVSPSDVTIATINDQRLIYGASPMLADNEVNVYIEGHAIRIQINDDILARAYKNLGVDALGTILQVGRAINGWMSKVYTGYNPEFILTNIVRDFTSGVINTTGEEGISITAKAVANYPVVFAKLLKYAATGKADKWIKSYRENGGNTGAAYLPDLERVGKEVQNEYAAYQGVLANLKQGDIRNASRAAGTKAFNVTLKYVEHLNQAGENAFRLSVFKAMIESGKSVNDAAHLAKNVTVNFNRRGEMGAQANALYLFFNANVQGTTALAHALVKGEHKYQAWGLVGAMSSLGALSAMTLGGFDDEEEYDKISDSIKSRNLIIKAGDGYVKIPIPYGYGFFYNAGRMTADVTRKGETGKLPYLLAALAIEEFSPFNVASTDEGEFDAKRVGFGVLPTAAKLYAEPAFNYSSFTGREVYPESPFDGSQPDNEKMFRGTKGTVYDITAQYLASAGVEITPETLKFLTRAATGGAGALVDSTVSAGILKSEDAELDTRELPFVRKGYGELTIQDSRAAYGRAKEEARTAAEKFRRLKRDNDMEGAAKFAQEHVELLAMNSYADKLSKFISQSRDIQDGIKASKDYSVKEKRLKIKEMEKEEDSYYDSYLSIFRTNKAAMKRRGND